MADDVLAKIDALEHEVNQLRKDEAASDAPEPRSRLHAAQRELDVLWDLRRRQQAADQAGLPRPTEPRSAGTIEDYRQ
ncbi:MAG: hypothetical protein JWL64_1139 [Frankiales bacterium]|nr:hypothetical protein [Frankiales bacterium]